MADYVDEKPEVGPNYYDWREVYPELSILKERYLDILEEARQVSTWVPWPEDHYAKDINIEKEEEEEEEGREDDGRSEASTSDEKEESGGASWTVFPFLHTFPAYEESKMSWIKSTCTHCPLTSRLIESIPNVRTALFSRMTAGCVLASHTGWADLANYVLRCHIALDIPTTGDCGLHVDEEVKLHQTGEIIVFDDSKAHFAFNHSDRDRIVLIVDIMRPPDFPLGTAVGGHTDELDSFISQFK